MMFKKIICGILILTFTSIIGVSAWAEERHAIPDGEILVIYSDGADKAAMQSVYDIVELLTYQSFKVSFVSASDSVGELDRFSYIICYQLENYPAELLEELKTLEQKTLEDKPIQDSGVNRYNILFMGNQCIRDYLDLTNHMDYQLNNIRTGKLTYNFTDLLSKESLVEENYFLFLKSSLDYTSGKIEVGNEEGYYCSSYGCITHIPVSDLSDKLVKAAFIREVAKWKWPYKGDPHTYAQYIVLNQVYPFQDPDKLLEIVEYLVDKKEPFVISVMPIYSNGNYPAMKQFCEVLKYAQANGGTIIMHSPINQMTTFDKDVINKYIKIALQIYMSQGVYPVALQVPHNWIFNNDTIEVMRHFSTIFTTDEVDVLVDETSIFNTNEIYKDGHKWVSAAVKLDDTNVSYTKVSSTAVYLDITESTKQLKDVINICQASNVPLKSLWDVDHSFWTEEDVLNYKNHIMMLNNKRIDTKFVPVNYDKNFKYNRNMLKRFSKDLSSENHKLIIAVVIVSLIFLSFIFIARSRNRHKFFIKNDSKDD